VSLRIPSSSRSPGHDLHRTIYYLGYPLGRFAGLNHRQLARQVGVIITTERIRRTLANKINLLVDSLRSIEAIRLALLKAESIFLRRAYGCFDTLRSSSSGSSRRSSSTTPPRAGSSSTTSPPQRVRVPQHVARLVTRLVASLVVDYSASRRLVVDYFASAARPGASARRAARHADRRAARRRLLLLAQAHRRLLRLRRASGCLGTSRGLSRRSSSNTPPRAGSSLTTSPPPRVQVPRHVARLVTRLVALLVVDYSASRRLVVDYFASATRPGASARRAARHAAHHVARRAARRRLLGLAQARRRLLRLCCASGCLGMSRGSSRGSSRRSSSTTPPRAGSSSTTSPPPCVRVPRHVTGLVTRLVAPLVIDYSASCRLVVDYSASRKLIVDYFASAARPGASARRAAGHADPRAGSLSTTLPRAGSSSTTLPPPHVRVPRHVARLITRILAQARRRLLRLRSASGYLGTSHGSSRGSSRRSSSTTRPRAGSSSTTSPPPRVRVPRHVARLVTRIVVWLVVDYFAYAARLGAWARRAAHRLLSTTAPTSRDRVPRHVARLVAWLVALLVVKYFAYAVRLGASARRAARHAAHRRLLRAPRLRLAATLALLQPRRAS
jgi:hypothetical protein